MQGKKEDVWKKVGHKGKTVKKAKKTDQDIFKECADTSYGHSIGLPIVSNKKQKRKLEQKIPQKKCNVASHLINKWLTRTVQKTPKKEKNRLNHQVAPAQQ